MHIHVTLPYSQCVRKFRLKTIRAETHGEDVAASCRHHLLGGHHGRARVDRELLVLITVDDAIGDVAVGAQVPVVGEDAIDGLAALIAVPLRQADAVGDLRESGRVVILVLDVNYDPHRGLAGGERPVDDCDLGARRRCVTLRALSDMSDIFNAVCGIVRSSLLETWSPKSHWGKSICIIESLEAQG